MISEIRPEVEIGGYRIESLVARGGMGLVFPGDGPGARTDGGGEGPRARARRGRAVPQPVSPTPRQSPAPARLSGSATEKRLAALRPAVDLDTLVADVQAGEISLSDAADRLRNDVLRLARLKAEAALLDPAPSHARATLLLESWIDAALRDVLAVQSWLAATRFDDPGAGAFLEQHERRSGAARAARKAFLDEYERVSAA